MKKHLWLLWCLLALLGSNLGAEEFILPPDDVDVVGKIRYEKAAYEDTLLDIARRNGLGQGHIANANPGMDLWIPGAGTKVLLPTRHILPTARREGLVLNLPEMRLYLYLPGAKGTPPKVEVHPISIGRYDWRTPLGVTKITAKDKDPVWRPTASLKAEAIQEGRTLPDEVPAGPDNPLGGYALRLGLPSYLIHGTDKPWGLGMRATHGCIRLYPEDIATVFNKVAVSMPVNFVDEPIKLGWVADTLFIEVHPPLEEDTKRTEDLLGAAQDLVNKMKAKHPFVLDNGAFKRAVEEKKGIPVPISK